MKPVISLLVAGGHSPPPLVDIDGTVFVQLGIFLLLLLVLTRLVFRPYLALRQERMQRIDGAKEDIQKLNQSATEKMATYEEQLARIRKEAALIRNALRQEGEANASELLSTARKQAESQVETTHQRLEKSAQAARLALRTRADPIARMVATKFLGREV